MGAGGIGEAFADRNFRIYSIGAIVSWLSFFIQLVAVSWTAWKLTGSTGWLAIIAALDIAPNLILAPLGGVLADRYDRFTIVFITMSLALLQALALTLLAHFDALTIGWLGALAVAHGAIHSFSVPAFKGNLPRFVERKRLASAIAVSSAYTQFAIFAGPAMGGWLIANHGVESAFFSNVVGYAIYLCTFSFLRTPSDFRQPGPSGRSLWGDWIDGLRYIVGHHGISTVLTLMLAGDALSAALTNMLPAYAATILGLGVGGMTSLLSAAGLGATFAALWLAHGGAGRATPGNVLWAFLAVALAVAALMFANSLVVALAIMLLYGMAGEVRRTSAMSLLQIAVSEAQRGRLMSAQFLLQRVAGGVAALAVGSSAEISGLRAPMWIGAALCVGVWLIAWRRRARIAAAFAPVAARA